ncbi:hypothetical protein SAMN05421874_1464 [Nonomuraea maritima]|uniref:Uncharacterized protein n=1 Tax=Nonomuraea maritima TaxID=683260 RepID=A0A1G9RJP0_9ACTN|nr:hypothetical protein [Nonomuraea maritima]SDM22645.1 hypothetical protein SAMN05421874_1464 [Nonomuraea maritima]
MMVGLEDAKRSRLITTIRIVADVMDNCADGLASTVLAATVLLIVIFSLHAVADVLEHCQDAHAGALRQHVAVRSEASQVQVSNS